MTRSMLSVLTNALFFSFIAPPPTELYTLSLHDALPIFSRAVRGCDSQKVPPTTASAAIPAAARPSQAGRCRTGAAPRSEEHTSELQSRPHLVCRLLLEKKKKNNKATQAQTDARPLQRLK